MTTKMTAPARASRTQAKRLPGRLAAPNLPRRTLALAPTPVLHPSRTNQMAIIVADEVIAAASLDSVTLTRSTLPNVLSSAIEVAMEDIDGQQMDRRSLMTSRAMAAHVLRFHQPARLIQARPEWLSTAAQDTLGARSLLMRRRSLWVDPDGIDSGLLIDRLHHTHLSGLLLDPWMAGKVAADTQAGTAIAKDRFLGVRVLAHRAPQSSIHVTPDGTHHRTGACAHCVGEVI